MKPIIMSNELGNRAREALTAVLHQASTIELKGIEEKRTPDLSRQAEFVVEVCVLGRSKTLACKVTSNGEARAVRKTLREFQEDAVRFPCDTVPVIIAPCLSAEARELCVEAKTGFLDFEDNARLVLGDMFIGKRSLMRHEPRATALPQAATVRKIPTARIVASAAGSTLPVISAA
jgi:hypothetical protein